MSYAEVVYVKAKKKKQTKNSTKPNSSIHKKI